MLNLPPWTSSTLAAHKISAAAMTAQHRTDEEDDATGFNIFGVNLSIYLSSTSSCNRCMLVYVYIDE